MADKPQLVVGYRVLLRGGLGLITIQPYIVGWWRCRLHRGTWINHTVSSLAILGKFSCTLLNARTAAISRSRQTTNRYVPRSINVRERQPNAFIAYSNSNKFRIRLPFAWGHGNDTDGHKKSPISYWASIRVLDGTAMLLVIWHYKSRNNIRKNKRKIVIL